MGHMATYSASATTTAANRSAPARHGAACRAGAPHSAPRRLVARHPVAAFLAMAFAFGWGSIVPLLLSRRGLDILPFDVPLTGVMAFTSLASFAGLVLPALLVMAATDGRAGVRKYVRRCLRWRVGLHWYAIALFGTFVAMLLAAVPFLGAAPLEALARKWELLVTVFLPGVLVPFLLVNLPEEAGWTGFLQARLQERHGPVLASALVAPPFALIHLPAYFVAGWISDDNPPLAQVPDVLVLVGLTAVLAVFQRLLALWLYNGSGRSAVIAALFHSAVNMSTGQQITPQFLPGFDPTWRNLFVWAVLAVAATVVALCTRGRLAQARRPRPTAVLRGERHR